MNGGKWAGEGDKRGRREGVEGRRLKKVDGGKVRGMGTEEGKWGGEDGGKEVKIYEWRERKRKRALVS